MSNLNVKSVELLNLYFQRNFTMDASTVRVLKLRNPKPDKHVKWNEETVDNEHLNKKKSKCCCIYKKPKTKFDESSSDTDDECENCFGHVEVKKKNKKEKHNQQPPDGNKNDEENPENNSHGPVAHIHSKCA